MCIGCTAYTKYLESIGVDTKNMSVSSMFHSSNSNYSSGSSVSYSSTMQGYSSPSAQAYGSNVGY